MREMSVTEQRYKAVEAVIFAGRTVGQVASEWGVCRQTMHRWLARYDNFYELKRYRTHQPDLPGWKVPASKLTFGSRPWMPPVPDAHVPADGVPLKLQPEA